MEIFKCSGAFSLIEEESISMERGCEIILDEETLSIIPKFESPMIISYRNIFSFQDRNFVVILKIIPNLTIKLIKLGYKYDDFLRIFSSLRNKILIKDLLMDESIKKTGVNANFVFYDEKGHEKHKGKCEIKLYETGIVSIPDKGEIIRIPYSDISDISAEDYSIVMKTDYDEKIVFSMMGMKYDSFKDTLSEIYTELQLKVQSYLGELLPNTNTMTLMKLARLMKEGKAAKRSDVESIESELWNRLEKRIDIFGIKDGYNFLKKYSMEQKNCIGIKRGLLGDLTGEYIWFMIPIYSNKFGNAIVIEAASEEGGGKATYFFRIVSRNEYQNLSQEDMNSKIDELIKNINRCMLAINFRREPIYLSDEMLIEPRYQKYLFAIQKISSLKVLRNLFIGRIIHYSQEQWENDVISLLKFNISSKDDNEKWIKEK